MSLIPSATSLGAGAVTNAPTLCANADLDETASLENAKRIADGNAAHVQLIGELPLGRQPLTDRQLPRRTASLIRSIICSETRSVCTGLNNNAAVLSSLIAQALRGARSRLPTGVARRRASALGSRSGCRWFPPVGPWCPALPLQRRRHAPCGSSPSHPSPSSPCQARAG